MCAFADGVRRGLEWKLVPSAVNDPASVNDPSRAKNRGASVLLKVSSAPKNRVLIALSPTMYRRRWHLGSIEMVFDLRGLSNKLLSTFTLGEGFPTAPNWLSV